MRPETLHVGGVLYWTIRTRDPDTMVLKDADATPTVAVRKNGSAVGDSVTVTKRSATTGLYDCSYDPAAEAEGDTFEFEERAQVTGTTTAQAYYDSGFVVRVRAVERGTDWALRPTVAARTLNVSADGAGDAVLDSATLTQLDDIETAVDANTGYLTAITSALSTLAAKVRKYFQISLRKDAAIATDNATELGEINENGGTGAGAFANTTESNEAIRDRGDAAWTTGSGGGSGSLTQEDLNAIIAGVQAVHLNITEAVENCGLTITKGDTWIQDIDGLGDLSTKRITFALKVDRRDADSAAIVFIDEADGLTYLNGAVAATPGDGAIEILDESAGDIRIRLESSATKLIPTGKYVDAVKAIKDNADFTLRNNGTTTVVYGVIQEIS